MVSFLFVDQYQPLYHYNGGTVKAASTEVEEAAAVPDLEEQVVSSGGQVEDSVVDVERDDARLVYDCADTHQLTGRRRALAVGTLVYRLHANTEPVIHSHAPRHARQPTV